MSRCNLLWFMSCKVTNIKQVLRKVELYYGSNMNSCDLTVATRTLAPDCYAAAVVIVEVQQHLAEHFQHPVT